MTFTQIIVLAIIQGLTEFLPISSSGHLVLVPSLFGWADQGLVFDVTVHFGSLIAVCTYFRSDVAAMIRGAIAVLTGKLEQPESRLALALGVGTIPAGLAGLMFAGWIAANLRSPFVVIATLAGYAILMALADRYGARERQMSGITLKDVAVIGVAQALALIPGTSRSGATITAGLALGFRREDAARFSFLLSIPIILLATMYEGWKLFSEPTALAAADLALAAAVSAIVAYISIEFFMRFVNAIGLLPFVLYRLVLAAGIYYVLV
ncbi:MAG: undecaprenyl-diphosphate phosphatase [Gammaproteobacteria bacterium]|nr:undecaprenyl-diphosphate phosphatase [Gammaproteobacteria bacterium]